MHSLPLPWEAVLFYNGGMDVKNMEVKYHKLQLTALAYERSLDDMERELMRKNKRILELEAKAQKRLDQIQFLLKENSQLKYEVETLREQFVLQI